MELLAVIFGFLFLAALILPWCNRARIAELEVKVEALRKEIDGRAFAADRVQESRECLTEETPACEERKLDSYPVAGQFQPSHRPWRRENAGQEACERLPEAATEASEVSKSSGFEFQVGARLPVWIGGVALALGAFYFVKYSIEAGWLAPAMRVSIGLLAGIAGLFIAGKIRGRDGFANKARISQSIAGAAIADLYICVYAAANIYGLVTHFTGFCGMAAVTGVAVVLSLRHGAPIALLGLVGGFLTPALMQSESPSAPMLLGYLYVVFVGLIAVIRKQRWWGLGLLAVIFALFWAPVWIYGPHYAAADALWVGLYVLAVAAAVVIAAWRRDGGTEINDMYGPRISVGTGRGMLSLLAMAGSVTVMALVVARNGFDLAEWGLFWLLAAAGLFLAWSDHKTYRLAPWTCLAACLAMMVNWRGFAPVGFLGVVAAFAALFCAGGHVLQLRRKNAGTFAGISAAAALGLYLVGYFRLHHIYTGLEGLHFWGALALGLCGVAVWTAMHIHETADGANPEKQELLAIYSGAATAFLSLGLAIEVDRTFLPVAVAGEVAGLA